MGWYANQSEHGFVIDRQENVHPEQSVALMLECAMHNVLRIQTNVHTDSDH